MHLVNCQLVDSKMLVGPMANGFNKPIANRSNGCWFIEKVQWIYGRYWIY
ncbi:5503_t:CDS:2 [Funneliformis geosporum]|nr:5503_t:CDS:2 [Funneliformis geosporum]